jgi:hypothetical protein
MSELDDANYERIDEVCKAFSSRLSGKLSIEISVAADPNPNPCVIWESLRHGAVVTRNADRPKARVSADALKLE